ncbi:MAG: hypothetical protein EA378_12200 [Phycisphaerales bacterium]|nr:MAG: hypothetical protein EA378_12200 [Phycisphaerales bacterium]
MRDRAIQHITRWAACAAGALATIALTACSSTQTPQDLGDVSVTHADAQRCGKEVAAQLVQRLRAHAQQSGELTFVIGDFENQTRSLSRRAYQTFRDVVVRQVEHEAASNPAITIVSDREATRTLHAESFRVGRGETAELMTEFRLLDADGGETWSAQLRAMLAMEPVALGAE